MQYLDYRVRTRDLRAQNPNLVSAQDAEGAESRARQGDARVAAQGARVEVAAAGLRLAQANLPLAGGAAFRIELQRPYWRRDRARNRWRACAEFERARPSRRRAATGYRSAWPGAGRAR